MPAQRFSQGKIKVNTHEVFVAVDKCLLPDGYIKPIKQFTFRKSSLQETSAFRRRMQYDDLQKGLLYGGDSALLPTSADFLKIKVEEKQKMLERDIEEGKQKIQEKRFQMSICCAHNPFNVKYYLVNRYL